MRKILILTERFYPEEFLVNDLAQEWERRGYAVDVLTQAPSYPYDRVYDGYTNKFYQTTSEFGNVKIHRVRTILGYNTSVKQKILNYISFMGWTSLWAVFNGWRYDAVFTCHTGPLTMAFAGAICRWLWWRKTMIWTQDPWPDSVYNYYGRKPIIWFQRCLNGLVRLIYWGYQTISVSCEGFIGRLRPYTRKTIHYFPQWTIQPDAVPDKEINNPIVFTFAGNIGSVQNLEKVVCAFGAVGKRSDIPRVALHLVGGGIFLERLKALVAENNFENIVIEGCKPRSEMPSVFTSSDVLIISLNAEFDLTVPAKFQAYIAAGRPILGIVRGDTAKIILSEDIGCVADPANEQAIQMTIIDMAQQLHRFPVWRENALKLSETRFSRKRIIDEMITCLAG